MKIFYLLIIMLVALTSCRKNDVIKYNPKAIELSKEASCFIMQRQYDKALSLLDQATEVDNQYYLAYSNKVNIYLFKNDYKNAFKQIQRVLELKKDFAEAWLLAGLIVEKDKNNKNAIKYYQKAINIFTKRINDKTKLEQINANKLNRAAAKILIGDEEGREELIELKEIPNYAMVVNMLLEKTREEIINEMMVNRVRIE